MKEHPPIKFLYIQIVEFVNWEKKQAREQKLKDLKEQKQSLQLIKMMANWIINFCNNFERIKVIGSLLGISTNFHYCHSLCLKFLNESGILRNFYTPGFGDQSSVGLMQTSMLKNTKTAQILVNAQLWSESISVIVNTVEIRATTTISIYLHCKTKQKIKIKCWVHLFPATHFNLVHHSCGSLTGNTIYSQQFPSLNARLRHTETTPRNLSRPQSNQ